MADYISRQAAINIVCDDECDDCPDGGCDMYRRLKRLPAADVRPVVRGKWVPQLTPYAVKDADICACSVCGESVWIYKDKSQPWNFCPNCGADMRGGGEDG